MKKALNNLARISLVVILLGAFSVAHAASAVQIDAQSSSGQTTLTSGAISAMTTALSGHSGSYYWIGTFTPPPYDNSTAPSNDWGWSGGYNGIFTSPSGITITNTSIPNGGAHIVGHDDIYMCMDFLFSGGTFTTLDSLGINDQCIHFHWTGTEYAGTSSSPPPPTPPSDGNINTHVIRISTPVLYATTTTPTALDFDIYNASSSVANAYRVTYTNIDNYANYYQYGFLVDSGYTSSDNDVPFTIGTTSPALPDGRYRVGVVLSSMSPDLPFPSPTNPSGYFNPETVSYFGVGSTTFQLIPTSATSSFSYASSSCAISFAGSFSLSDCFGYLFLPSQNWFTSYTALPTALEQTFPFSYPFSMVNTWNSLTASTTENAPTYTFNFGSLNIGSSTSIGNILPNVTTFGATTTNTFFAGATLYPEIRGLISVVLWLTFFADVFFTVRNMITV